MRDWMRVNYGVWGTVGLDIEGNFLEIFTQAHTCCELDGDISPKGKSMKNANLRTKGNQGPSKKAPKVPPQEEIKELQALEHQLEENKAVDADQSYGEMA